LSENNDGAMGVDSGENNDGGMGVDSGENNDGAMGVDSGECAREKQQHKCRKSKHIFLSSLLMFLHQR